MGQSLVQNYLHLVFATRYRKPLIDAIIETKLHEYMDGICDNLDSPAIKIGGHFDHIHIACSLSKKIALVDFLEELKKSSSKWLKKQGEKYENFFWQGGYGAFSVSPSQIDQLVLYIQNQHEHHQKMSFQEEYRELLKKYKVEYDERYVWD